MPSPLICDEIHLKSYDLQKVEAELAEHELHRPDFERAKTSPNPRLQREVEIWCERKRSLLFHRDLAKAELQGGWRNTKTGEPVKVVVLPAPRMAGANKGRKPRPKKQAMGSIEEMLEEFRQRIAIMNGLTPGTPEYAKARDRVLGLSSHIGRRIKEEHAVGIELPEIPPCPILYKARKPLPPSPDPVIQARRERDMRRAAEKHRRAYERYMKEKNECA